MFAAASLRRAGRWSVAPVAAALLVLPAGSARAQADVMAPARVSDAELFDLVPADAELVVVVPSASRLSDRLADFGQATGLNQYAPELGNALTSFKRQMAFEQGVNDDGAMLLIIGGLAEAARGESPAAMSSVMLAPVRDFSAFVTQLGGDAQAEGATAVTLPGQTQGSARAMEDYAILGETQHVEAYQPAEQGAELITQLGELPGRTVTRSDALLYVDSAKLGPVLEAWIDRADAADAAQDTSPNWASLLRPWLPAARALAQGSDRVVVGLTLSDAGLEVDAAVRLRDGSTLASYFADPQQGQGVNAGAEQSAESGDGTEAAGATTGGAAEQAADAEAATAETVDAEAQPQSEATAADSATGTDSAEQSEGQAEATAAVASGGGDLLSMLPGDPYILAGSLAVDTATAERLRQGLAQTLAEMPDGPGTSLMRSYVDSFALLNQTHGVASVLYVPQPTNMMSGGFFSGLTLYRLDDAAQFLAAQKQYVQQLGETAPPADTPPPAGADPNAPATADATAEATGPAPMLSFRTSYTDKALVIDGINVDQYAINYVLPPAMMQQFGPTAALLGNSGQSGYLAAKGQHALISTVPDPQLITRGLRALDQSTGLGQSPAIAQLRDQPLPEDAWLELYFNVGGVAQTVNPFLPMLLPAAPAIQVPADLPPLALAASSDGSALLIRGVVPTSLIDFGVKTYEQMAPALQPMLRQTAPETRPTAGSPRAPR